MKKSLFLSVIIYLIYTISSFAQTTFIVDNIADTDNLAVYTLGDGTNTLRKCIRLANLTGATDNINFNIPSAPYKIVAATALAITNPVVLDGLSQPGASAGNLLIEINGNNIANNGALELRNATSSGSTIQGLVIYGSQRGIYVNASNGNTIKCNYIGTNATGTARIATPDTLIHGIYINNSQNTVIGGTGGVADRNIISGCGQNGIRIGTTSTGTTIIGNYIGTDVTGTIAIPNCQLTGGPYAGIMCATGSNNTTIGGSTGNHMNIISGNLQRGIYIQASINCSIQNNLIGTTISGNVSMPNSNNGIESATAPCTNLQIYNNIVSANLLDGIKLTNSDRSITKGNKIGIGADGITMLGNGNYGLEITNSFKPVIGSGILSERNYVSNNVNAGIRISNGDSTILQGNYIGTDITGTLDYGNTVQGVYISNGSDYSIIGGLGAGEGNLISGNNQRGLYIQASLYCKAYGNFIGTTVTGNAALGNGTIGIEVASLSGVTFTGFELINNVVASNGARGVYFNSSSPNVDRIIIKGNKIGISFNGTTPLGNGNNGLEILNSYNPTIGGSLVSERNYVSKSVGSGIVIINGDSAIVKGNYVGTDITGTLDYGNTSQGINLSNGSDYSIVGGNGAGEGNLISGNDQRGIYFQGSVYCKAYGNFVGTTVTGNAALGNGTIGIEVASAGGIAFTGFELINNVVASSGARGVYFNSSAPSMDRVIIKGNKIGIGFDGTTPLGNSNNGLEILNSYNPTIGGSLVSERNYISKNAASGIVINNGDSTIIKGNYIGTDITGTLDYGNVQQGVSFSSGSDYSIIGGNAAGERNLISGNDQRGIYMQASINCSIINNFIGTDITGNVALGNSNMGIEATSTSSFLKIFNNVISSNGQNGVRVNSSDRPVIKGNKVGVGLDGITALGNQFFGIEITNSFKPIVGSSVLAERNHISNNGYNFNLPLPSNRYHGLRINNGDSAIVQGNYIGVDLTGMLDQGNAQSGVSLKASDNAIVGGSNTGEGNLISGNGQAGIAVNADFQDTTLLIIVKGNIIGLGVDLTTIIPNDVRGIDISNCPAWIGGTTLNERNYIANNGSNGIQLSYCPASVIKGNYIGVDGSGLLNRGNNSVNVRIDKSREVIIGGATSKDRNLICASKTSHGILLTGGSAKCIVKGNFVGVGADGKTDLGNWQHGLFIVSHSDSTIVGGSNYMERNIFSWNGKTQVAGDGIRVEGGSIANNIYGNIILGNYCGVDSTGKTECPNIWAGISLNESSDNIVGGPGPDDGNICSSNGNEGMYFRNATRNKIIGNYIGTDKTGTVQMGNDDWALNFSDVGANYDNIVGGSSANANIIAYNDNVGGIGPGVRISYISYRNLITFNKIYCNAGSGIYIEPGGNEGVPAPVILFSNPNDLSGTGIDGYTIHAYVNATSDGGVKCDCEGEIYLGSAVVAGGVWTITHNQGLSAVASLSATATQTNPTNLSGNSFPVSSTSEFSNCNAPLPVTLLSFEVKKAGTNAVLEWTTSSEKNNNKFEIERSLDGIHFYTIGTVSGSGNSSDLKSYTFVDELQSATIVYYRIKQIDFNGKSMYSQIRSLTFPKNALAVYATDSKEVKIEAVLEDADEFNIALYTVAGQLIYSNEIEMPKGYSGKSINFTDLATGVYIIKIYSREQSVVRRIEIR